MTFNTKDWVAICIIFFIALSVRLLYQQNAKVRNYVISDAREYFLGAYNLRFFGVYSTSPPPALGKAPLPNAGRTPGYSLFLLPFLYMSKTLPGFLNKVMTAQAVMGAFTAVLAFLISRLYLPFLWAIAGGMLTALSPHLIAMDDYLLTESLFTFVLISAFYFMCLSLRLAGRNGLIMGALSGFFFGWAFLVKPMAMLLGPFMMLVYFVSFENSKLRISLAGSTKAILLLFTFIFTISPYFIRNHLVLKKAFPEQGRGWASIVDGTYINLIYKDPRFYGYPYKDDPLNTKMHQDKKFFWNTFKKRFKERPLDYIKWYLGGKILCSWRWNVVTGHHDVYVYPMKRFGFQTNKFLFFIHGIMKDLHWPLFWFAVLPPFAFIWFAKRKSIPANHLLQLPYLAIIIYFFAIVTVMFPIPRYTIPIRPYVYNLALFNIFTILNIIMGRYRTAR